MNFSLQCAMKSKVSSEPRMLKILGCVAWEHDLRLVAVSAVVCGLGCFTTTKLVARAGECVVDPRSCG